MTKKMVSFANVNDTDGDIRFIQCEDDELPSWAVDVKPYFSVQEDRPVDLYLDVVLKTALLIVAVMSMIFFSLAAIADNRINKLETAWNRADRQSVQSGFHKDAVYYQVRLAEYSENGGVLTVIDSGMVSNKTLAAIVQLEDKQEVWLFIECKTNSLWCYWDHRPIALVGSAEYGQSFDLATTAVAIGEGFTEANPLGLAVIVPVKIGLTAGTHYMKYDDCMSWRTGLDMVGYGAGVANIATMLGAPPVGAAITLAGVAWYRYSPAIENARFECAEYSLSD